MLYGEYRLRAVFEEAAILPPFKGSTFRGGFGQALKKVVCALKKEQCQDCLLRERCVYFTVFEVPSKPGKATPPHPFVIEPSLSAATHFKAGDSFDFGLLLFGSANNYLPYFVYAFEHMGKMGLGRRINGKRPAFRLHTVTSGEEVLYEAGTGILKNAPVTDLKMAEFDPGCKDVGGATLILQTPLRLKYHNRLSAQLPFHVLVRAALRRISALNKYFGEGEPPLDYKGLVIRAREMRVTGSTLRWFDISRYSNRQQASMLIGGMVGSVTYQGNLKEFIPLLRYCEKVHLGKATTFGLGKIEVIERDFS
jgi:hypothetical protein